MPSSLVRLQIGDSNAAGYKNWYRISDFYEWQAIFKFKRGEAEMADDGSKVELDNSGWQP